MRLEIADRGIGFDTHVAHEQATLGLVSMRERVRLVQGELQIDSKKGLGTHVVIRVPIANDFPACT